MIRWCMVGALLLCVVTQVTILVLASIGADVSRSVPVIVLTWLAPAAYLAASVAVVVDAVLRARRRDLRALAGSMVWVKAAAVPFFVLNFVFMASASLFSIILGVFVVVVIALLVAVTYLLMLPTSAYGIAALVRMRRDRVVGAGYCWAMLLLHLVFVADVVASILVALRIRGLLAAPPVANVELEAYARVQGMPPVEPIR